MIPSEADARLWAYLSDPMPTEGASRLLAQKRIVDGIAVSEGRGIDRYIVDSGSALTDDGRGARLEAMIEELDDARRRIILVIAGLNHLAPTPLAIAKALADILAIGVAFKDASGELHPSIETVARAKAAASPARQRAKCLPERSHV